MIQVTIVSPNHALRVGLREMLNNQANIEIVGEVVSLEDVNERETEVAILASVSSVRFLEKKNFAILFLTDDVDSLRGFINSNLHAWGVLSANTTEEELVAGILSVSEGLWVGAPSLMQGLMRLPKSGEGLGEESLLENLTTREKEVLEKMAEGLANKQIALALSISEHTVKFHLSSLYAKLGVASRTEAVKRGIELGLISL
ncbi:MAG: response regulator transcription factor [Anaerolineales bacterium]|nr:response regulator transcription factor [Anaerolineales bacterium]